MTDETTAREDILSIVCLAGEYPADKLHLASLQSEAADKPQSEQHRYLPGRENEASG